MKDWQFRQVIDAIRIILVDMAGLDWVRTFDWDLWRESTRSLQSSYPTEGVAKVLFPPDLGKR